MRIVRKSIFLNFREKKSHDKDYKIFPLYMFFIFPQAETQTCFVCTGFTIKY
jgi:hypothetical protein